MFARLPYDAERTPTVGYGNAGFVPLPDGYALDVGALIASVSEGYCPGCRTPLAVHPLFTYHHRQAEPWGCCSCCGRAWILEMRDSDAPPYVVTTFCRQHGSHWDCDHPLPGASWTAARHAASLSTSSLAGA